MGIMHCNHNDSNNVYAIDSTSLKVCTNKRIFNHKVNLGLAERGKNSLGFFFGFKLHAVCDSLGKLVSLMITPGNIDDRKYVLKLLKGLKGIAIGDANYISKELIKTLSKQ
ncbi:MAG: transposase, partial [bacterium]|nr:transposase [bacterium]